ncbi:unnamed protein product [Vitrella brassicaformis CCMP3155]|uniref:RING-type domain-containing protein n=1 Tax=Vitrella brassicaformis (strain CCMP3155) TaxID=1169540 RepID=A0A0G4GQA8_VITBC|nr:unnamed protein product [Vitrella brassicaformis CCMP3155]|eukprot:CEM32642.1 unnamed protein product [Vitrella brassicaformis CCMP3155]
MPIQQPTRHKAPKRRGGKRVFALPLLISLPRDKLARDVVGQLAGQADAVEWDISSAPGPLQTRRLATPEWGEVAVISALTFSYARSVYIYTSGTATCHYEQPALLRHLSHGAFPEARDLYVGDRMLEAGGWLANAMPKLQKLHVKGSADEVLGLLLAMGPRKTITYMHVQMREVEKLTPFTWGERRDEIPEIQQLEVEVKLNERDRWGAQHVEIFLRSSLSSLSRVRGLWQIRVPVRKFVKGSFELGPSQEFDITYHKKALSAIRKQCPPPPLPHAIPFAPLPPLLPPPTCPVRPPARGLNPDAPAFFPSAASTQPPSPASAPLPPPDRGCLSGVEEAVQSALDEADERLRTVTKENDELKERLEEATKCAVCLDADKSVAVFPCRHLYMCAACAQQVIALPAAERQCAKCRGPIQRIEYMYV